MDTVKRVVAGLQDLYVEYDDHLQLDSRTGIGTIWVNCRLVKDNPQSDWKLIHRDTQYEQPKRLRSASPHEYITGLTVAMCALTQQVGTTTKNVNGIMAKLGVTNGF